jgi:hypothetical protein
LREKFAFPFRRFPLSGPRFAAILRHTAVAVFLEVLSMSSRTLLFVASIAIGSLALTGCKKTSSTSNQPTASNQTGEQATPAGERMGAADQNAMVPDSVQRDVRNVMSKITEDALTNGDFKKVISYLTKADRDRIGDVSNLSTSDLDIQINQFQQNWKNKYNENFSIKDKEVVFGSDLRWIPGLSNMPDTGARPAGGRMNPETPSTQPTTQPSSLSDQARQSADRAITNTRDTLNRSTDNVGQMTSTDPKKAVTVILPSQQNLPHLMLPFINEGTVMNDWRLNVPDTLTAQTIHDNLLQQLTQLNSQSANWPNDPNQASRIVATHVFQALEGHSASSSSL